MSNRRVFPTLFLISSLLTAAEPFAATDILDRCAQTQDRLESMISTSEDSYRWVQVARGQRTERNTFEQTEIRFDGRRCSTRTYMWGNINDMATNVPREEPFYVSRLWDGETFAVYTQSRPKNYPGTVNIRQVTQENRGREMLARGYRGHEVMGRFWGDDERADVILRQVDTLSMRRHTERVGQSDCYVVEAKSDRGRYTLWIDPSHGYNIARAEVERQPGHLFRGKVLPEGYRIRTVMENVTFAQQEGVWVPMEAEVIMSKNSPNGDYYREDRHHRRTGLTLNPDHDALGSFVPDDILEGARVRLSHAPGIRYRWHDGKPVPNIEDEVIEELEKTAARIIVDGHAPPSLAGARMNALRVLDQYAATQNRLRSLVAKATSKTEYDVATEGVERTEDERCEFRTDDNRTRLRRTFWDGVTAAQEHPHYESILVEGATIIQYRRGLDSQNDRVFLRDDPKGGREIIGDEYKGAALTGLCPGSGERIDDILRKAEDLSLLPTPEQVGDVACRVIEGRLNNLKYRVWIDPEHAYHVAKMTVSDSETGALSFSLDSVRFEQIQDLWVPMEGRMEQTTAGKRTRWHYRRAEVIVNPDHDALNSFVVDDIPDGTKVLVYSDSGTAYLWKDGKVAKDTQ